MKVGDGQKAQRGQEAQREGAKKKESSRGEEQRSFRDVMKERAGRRDESRGVRAEEKRGDERGRRLRDGELQKQEREGQARELTRRRDGDAEPGKAGIEKGKEGGLERAGADIGASARRGAQSAAGAEEFGARQSLDVGPAAGAAGQVGAAQQSAPMQGSTSPALAEIANKIVQAVRVGEDAQARRVVFLDVTVPGRGDVRIRVRRDGGGMEVRMRADNDALARTLQEGVGDLREEGARKGIQFTSVQVVR